MPSSNTPDTPLWATLTNNTAASWWRDAGLRRCMVNVALLWGSMVSWGYDAAFISSVQGFPFWNSYFDAPAGIRLGLITSAYVFPQVVFPFACSFYADRYGRKPAIRVGAAFGIIGPMVSAFGTNLAAFVAGRVLTGVSTAFFFVIVAPLIAEIAHPRFRAVVQATIYSSFAIGAFICGWIGFGLTYYNSNWQWRILTLLQCTACLPLFAASLTPLLVESPRYLAKTGQQEAALRVLAKLHSNGDENDQLVRAEFHEILEALEAEARLPRGRWSEFIETRGNQRRLLTLVFFAWVLSMSGQNLLAYYLPVILVGLGFHTAVSIQGIIAGNFAVLFLASFAGSQVIEKVGRKKLLMFSLLSTAIAFTIFTGLTAGYVNTMSRSISISVVPFVYIVAGSIVCGTYPVGFAYMPEILPFHLRSQGMAIFTVITNLGALYNALVNPVALTAINWKYYLIFVVGDWIQLVIGFFLIIETKGRTIEQIQELFGDPAVEPPRGGDEALGKMAKEEYVEDAPEHVSA